MCSNNRRKVAADLYLKDGADAAAHRCEANSRYGSSDLVQTLIGELALKPGNRLVDVGCGAGQHLARFAPLVLPHGAVFGCDFSKAAVVKARHLGFQAFIATADELPLKKSCIDAMTCNYAIYYFPELKKAVKEWNRVLKPGGRLVISGPAADTNAELYELHRQLTGSELSDADKMALGYVYHTVHDELSLNGYAKGTLTDVENVVSFPNREAFLSYWSATSLFLRTVPPVDSVATVERAAEALKHVKQWPVCITKRTDVLTTFKVADGY